MIQNSELIAGLSPFFVTRDEGLTALLAAHVLPLQIFTNLIGYWPAGPRAQNGDVNDLGGRALHLTYANAFASTHGLLPVANFNGSTSRLSRTSEAILNSSNPGFSAGCWVRFDNAAGSNEYIMSKWLLAGDNRQWVLYRNSSGQVQATVNPTGASGAGVVVVTAETVATGEWAHVAFTFLPSTHLRVFLNGEYTELTAGVPASLFAGTADLTFGAESGGGSHMDGQACQWWLTRSALKPEQIQFHYQYTKALFT